MSPSPMHRHSGSHRHLGADLRAMYNEMRSRLRRLYAQARGSRSLPDWRALSSRLGQKETWSRLFFRVPRRGRVVVALVLAISLIALVDRAMPDQSPVSASSHDVAAGASASSSAWYCAMTPSERAFPLGGAVRILNPTDGELTGNVTFFPTVGEAADVPVTIPARSRLELPPGETVDAPFSASLVRLNGGGAVVEHGMIAEQGLVSTPCATTASSRWYTADGATEADATMLLGLFNPFLEDAVADLRFSTNDGRAAPGDFQGLVVPSRQLLVLNVGDHLRRRIWVSSTIEARRGRLVVEQLQRSSVDGVKSSALSLAAPATGTTWFVPNLNSGTGRFADRLSVYNTSKREARATLELTGDSGPLDPIELFIPAGGRTAFDLGSEERVLRESTFSAELRAQNGEELVVARTSAARDPEIVTGNVLHPGGTTASRSWAFAYGKTDEGIDESIWVFNPGQKAAELEFSVTGEGATKPAGGPVTVEPGRRYRFVANDPVVNAGPNPNLLLKSSEPVVAGREYQKGGAVLSASFGLRLK